MSYYFCVQNQYLWFPKLPLFRNIWIYPNRCYVLLKCGKLWNLFSIPKRNACFFLWGLFIKKILRQILRYITNEEKPQFMVYLQWVFGQIDPCDGKRTSVGVFVTAARSPSQLFTPYHQYKSLGYFLGKS